MALNTFSFLIFFSVVVVIYFGLPTRYRYIWLFFSSCFFYLSADVRYAVGPVVSILTTYFTARFLPEKRERVQKGMLVLCVTVNIIFLLIFRYTALSEAFLPPGISFYVLQAIGYVIDVRREEIEPEKNLMRYAVYVIFFPTVTSGPIQRAPLLLRQLREGREFDATHARSGLYYLLWGYLLKIVMANRLSGMVNFAFEAYEELPGATLLWANILYAVQLYCDFAGYSALAVGSAKILGFDIAENFEQPYFAGSVKEFWRRWHISLSSWLKDYIYIPLGGNRKGRLGRYRNLMITFLVSGLWHGTGFHFLFWGILHGSYQVLEDCIKRRRTKKSSAVSRGIGITFTFLLTDFAWLFFRSESISQALQILKRMILAFRFKEMTYYGSYLLGNTKGNLFWVLSGIVVLFLVDVLHETGVRLEEFSRHRIPVVIRWIMYIVLTLLILYTVVCNYGLAADTFIYAGF